MPSHRAGGRSAGAAEADGGDGAAAGPGRGGPAQRGGDCLLYTSRCV
ncbi:hypothetical protein [Streptomyces fragilis]|nr:hypothetical protein [Streptomyces fragilis]